MDGLEGLERDLEAAAERMPAEARAVVSKGALNIKNEWRDAWDDLREHAKHVHKSIGYDISQAGGDEIIANIGPDANRDKLQGPLGGIIEFGSPTSAPIPGGGPALLRESPRFEDALGDAAERLLSGE
jgi:hypothetical protein